MFIGGFDLAFMVDASSSIGGEANFRIAMNFVTRVFHSFTLGKGVRYGLVVFGDSVKVSARVPYFFVLAMFLNIAKMSKLLVYSSV